MRNPEMLKFVPDCSKTKIKKCVIKLSIFIPLSLYGKAVNVYSFGFDFVPDWYKTQKKCGRVVYENPFLVVYCPNKYISQKMCDEAVDDCLAALKFFPGWFVASKTIKKKISCSVCR